jgi:chromosome segregation ATPase
MPSEAEHAEQARFDARQAINRERDELRAEVERLRGTCEWQADNDRKNAETISRLLAEIRHFRAEVERLRAALTEITELDLEGDASLDDAIGLADEALHPSPTETLT